MYKLISREGVRVYGDTGWLDEEFDLFLNEENLSINVTVTAQSYKELEEKISVLNTITFPNAEIER